MKIPLTRNLHLCCAENVICWKDIFKSRCKQVYELLKPPHRKYYSWFNKMSLFIFRLNGKVKNTKVNFAYQKKKKPNKNKIKKRKKKKPFRYISSFL